MLDELKSLAERAEQVRKDFVEEAKAKLQPAFMSIFAAHPCIKAFGWTQYTPYFNDGEPCEFGVSDLHASASDERGECFYSDGWVDVGGKVEAGFTQESWAALDQLSTVLQSMDEVLQAAFGDHVQVIVTPEGVDIEEYEHD